MKPGADNFAGHLTCDGRDLSDKHSQQCLHQNLRHLNIVFPDETVTGYCVLQDWERGGAETYIAIAKVSVRTEGEQVTDRKFVAKAIVVFGIPIDKTAAIWIDRRGLLQKYIQVPHMFAYHKGVIYEEFIPYTVDEILDRGWSQRTWVVRELAKVASTLDTLGFRPINVIPNIRATDHDVYWIDFGADLGSASGERTTAARDLLQKELSLGSHYKTLFSETYSASLAELREAVEYHL